MRFLAPLTLIGLALVALPVAIHMLVRRRAKRMDFPSLRFLRETPSFRVRPRRIQQPLLLALRVAAIAFLVLGLSRPLITFGRRTQRTRIILLDASLSMQAQGRADAARERARRVISDLTQGERVAIIAFATDSLLLCSFTSDKHGLNEAIDRYQPASGAANYAEGFNVADALLQSEPPGEVSIDLVSDFQESGLRNLQLVQLKSDLFARARVLTHAVGASLGRNAFLVDEDVIAGEAHFEVSASELVTIAGERSGVRKSWTMDRPGSAGPGLVWRTEQNGQVTASLGTVAPDDFDADDERYIAFTSPRKGRALLIERDGDDASPYLRAALEATATDLGDKRFAVEVKSSLPGNSAELSSYSLVTLNLHGTPRSDELHTLASYVRSGGMLWLCMANDLDTSQWNQFANTEVGHAFPFAGIERRTDSNDALGFGAVDSTAPALRFLNEQVLKSLQGVRMRQGFVVTPRVATSTIMRWNDSTPAFVGMKVGTGSVLLLATSPARDAGDLGASAAFPALVSTIARVGIALREPLAREIGQPVDLGLAPGASVKITHANGKSATTEARNLILYPANYFSSPGIYRVESEGFERYMAVNSPAAESEISLAPVNEVEEIFKVKSANTVRTTSAWHDATERQSNLWRLFLLIAFGLLVAGLFITIKQSGRARMKEEG